MLELRLLPFLHHHIAVHHILLFEYLRFTTYKKSLEPYGFLYLFEDPQLRGEEENLLLSKVAEGKLSMDDYPGGAAFGRRNWHCLIWMSRHKRCMSNIRVGRRLSRLLTS